MILQPIVENALTHGLHNKDIHAELLIDGKVQDKMIIFEITDNGSGIPPAELQELQRKLSTVEIEDFPEPGLHGVALCNIQRRIRLRFGNEYGIVITSTMEKGTKVSVKLPFIADKES